MGVQNKDIRINWDSEPRLTNHLVNLIAANTRYSACIFGNNTGDRWLIERELCLEVLKQEPWMRDKEVQGWVRRSANGWEATDKWTSGMVHPVRNRLHLLVKRMKEGWYKSKYAIDPEWSCEEQIPEVTRVTLGKDHPYYFTLRSLWLNNQQPVSPATSAAFESSHEQGKSKQHTISTSRCCSSAKNAGQLEGLHTKGSQGNATQMTTEPLSDLESEQEQSPKRPRIDAPGRSHERNSDEEVAVEDILAKSAHPADEPNSREERKGRGRPKGSNRNQLQEGFPAENSTALRPTPSLEKRPRGRPKGSLNKKGKKVEVHDEGREMPKSLNGEPVKRGRGRPKGSTNKRKLY
ncbi:hypothetical protein CNBG_1786 [Cryptococcus deuterogattii R265]|uniref:Uncharacterized protein n=1 Tax=Cryptococcus deuterogattii (strain R265) TaxID=294750 RepID=A0A095EEV8_CRYD2|nr:hypothetical protein CNBG_1786 [Cryptococcus deuterogattii R265]KIR26638.1 hypothetical protein I309_04407 [Cryptococcus deuterogattii LA55]KIR72143.1 hypothetical protein I310_04196 [Cryptococcus deuterogattii CA1014]KIR93704.1 hypothetical protein I304_02379 [Cryptococcus deuterogattii CBS 10090]